MILKLKSMAIAASLGMGAFVATTSAQASTLFFDLVDPSENFVMSWYQSSNPTPTGYFSAVGNGAGYTEVPITGFSSAITSNTYDEMIFLSFWNNGGPGFETPDMAYKFYGGQFYGPMGGEADPSFSADGDNGGWLVGTAATGGYVLTITAATATPLPAALPLFATGVGGLGLLGWRRKRKNAAASAAA